MHYYKQGAVQGDIEGDYGRHVVNGSFRRAVYFRGCTGAGEAVGRRRLHALLAVGALEIPMSAKKHSAASYTYVYV